MTRALLSYGVGPHEELLDIALPSFRRFADRHGYDLLLGNDLCRLLLNSRHTDRPPSWWKVPLLETALFDYDEVLWVGADLVIVDTSEDVDVPSDAWQALVEHQTPDGNVPGADFWLVRKPMIAVLKQMWGMTHHITHGWWEQAALAELMGYDLQQRPLAVRGPTGLHDRTWFLHPEWNLHLWEQREVDYPRVLHATMYDDRAAVMREWAATVE